MKKNLLISAAIVACLTLSGCVIHIDKNGKSGVSSVFGGVTIDDGRTTGNVSTVNGGVDIGSNANVGTISTVNGGVELGTHATARNIDVVNGDIELFQHAKVNGDTTTVNGGVSLFGNNYISGDVVTVNGDIEVISSTIDGSIETNNGDINLTEGVKVGGDIVFKEGKRKYWESSTPTLTIDSDSHVSGSIILLRPVTLKIKNPTLMEKIEYRYEAKH